MYESTAQMLTDIKLMLGEITAEKDALLKLILDQTGQKVLNETGQEHMPTALEGIVVEMAKDAYAISQGDADAGKIAGSVASVSDNGQSVSYRDSAYSKVLESVSQTVKDYKAQLDRFSKTGW